MKRSRRVLLAIAAALLGLLLIVPAAGAEASSSSTAGARSLIYQESVTFNLDLSNAPIGEIVTQETFFGNVSYGTWQLTINGVGVAATGQLLANHRSDGLTASLTMLTPDLAFATLSFTVMPPATTGQGTFSYWVWTNSGLQSGSESFTATELGPQDYSVSFSQIPPIFAGLL